MNNLVYVAYFLLDFFLSALLFLFVFKILELIVLSLVFI